MKRLVFCVLSFILLSTSTTAAVKKDYAVPYDGVDFSKVSYYTSDQTMFFDLTDPASIANIKQTSCEILKEHLNYFGSNKFFNCAVGGLGCFYISFTEIENAITTWENIINRCSKTWMVQKDDSSCIQTYVKENYRRLTLPASSALMKVIRRYGGYNLRSVDRRQETKKLFDKWNSKFYNEDLYVWHTYTPTTAFSMKFGRPLPNDCNHIDLRTIQTMQRDEAAQIIDLNNDYEFVRVEIVHDAIIDALKK